MFTAAAHPSTLARAALAESLGYEVQIFLYPPASWKQPQSLSAIYRSRPGAPFECIPDNLQRPEVRA